MDNLVALPSGTFINLDAIEFGSCGRVDNAPTLFLTFGGRGGTEKMPISGSDLEVLLKALQRNGAQVDHLYTALGFNKPKAGPRVRFTGV